VYHIQEYCEKSHGQSLCKSFATVLHAAENVKNPKIIYWFGKVIVMKHTIVDKIRKTAGQYSYLSVLLFYLAIQAVFSHLENTVVPRYYMENRLDRYIPFVKVFVVPYLFWFIYIVGALVYLGLRSRKDFLGLCAFMFIGMSICMVIYYLLPNGQRLRPIIMDTDIFSRMIKAVYKNDTPTNVAPSIHVLNSIAVHVALVRYEPFGKNRLLKWTSFAIMVSIILSTVFIKQHAAIDVLWGMVLSCAMYYLVYRVLPFDKPYAAFDRVVHENVGSRSSG